MYAMIQIKKLKKKSRKKNFEKKEVVKITLLIQKLRTI